MTFGKAVVENDGHLLPIVIYGLFKSNNTQNWHEKSYTVINGNEGCLFTELKCIRWTTEQFNSNDLQTYIDKVIQ